MRIPGPGKPEAAPTIWSTVADLTNERYVFSSTTRPNIVWVNLDKLDFSERSPVEKLDLQAKLALEGGIAGNVNDRFADSGDIQPVTSPRAAPKSSFSTGVSAR